MHYKNSNNNNLTQILIKQCFVFVLLTVPCNCFNLSSIIDKNELWNLLLRRDIGHNTTDALYFHSPTKTIDNPSVPYEYDYQNDMQAPVVKNINNNKNSNNDDDDYFSDRDNFNVTFYDDNDEITNVDKLNSTIISIFANQIEQNETIDSEDRLDENSLLQIEEELSALTTESTDQYENDLENLKIKREEMIILSASPTDGELDTASQPLAELENVNEIDEIKVQTNKYSGRKPGQTSLVLVFDGTGSMESCLIQLRSGAQQIIEKFADRDDNPIYNYVFVPFRDPRKFI